ncbi:hypothetical protein FD723_18665 [Nostoc sp. C052]|uniref:hypothetical protein n=1 Tax=Nostoc sp. C052 TaxID=2576902 RepID=UPI0015C3AC4E|nr:hypothetical protein [Nostoc sp. C052]QLE42243.1 hypothetical protein FD723_18665 [Nostoc sp. C052]
MPKKILVTIEGRTQCVSDWAKEKGVSPITVHQRIGEGCTPEQAILKGKRTRPPHCPVCDSVKTIWRGSTTQSIRFKCNDCGKQSRIQNGQIMERKGAKKKITLFLTPKAWENIENEARNRGIGIDELIEEFGRQINSHTS